MSVATTAVVSAFFVAFVLCFAASARADSGSELAPTPPMGWNSWNCVGHDVTEELICGIADAMVESGMKEAGYTYIVVDDMWHRGRVDAWHADADGNMVEGGGDVPGRDENGILLHDTNKFPNGIKYVADYVHSKGLKFGLYTVPGRRTCAGCTGSRDFEVQDLETFAKWGVDFIKLDHCGAQGDVRQLMKIWRDGLDRLDRPIVLSVNMGIHDWMGEYADMWRTTMDIMGVWSYKPGEMCLSASISNIINLQLGTEPLHGKSGWNDPDMLQVGNWGLTEDENKAHFGIWCIMGAPLIAGNDLRTMSKSTRKILTNPELIAVDQDPLGHRGEKVRELGMGKSIWAKRLADPTRLAVALLNASDTEEDLTVDFADVGIAGTVYLRDLFERADLGEFSGSYSAKVPAHGVVILQVSAFERIGTFAPIPAIGDEDLVIQCEEPMHYYGGGRVLSELEGYSGDGYVLGENHDWRPLEFIWIVPLAEEGDYTIGVRYGNGTESELPYSLFVNHRGVGQLSFASTGALGKWGEVSRTVSLRAGYNQIRIVAHGPDKNALALDSLRVVPSKQ